MLVAIADRRTTKWFILFFVANVCNKKTFISCFEN
jgi:hypothetical protein